MANKNTSGRQSPTPTSVGDAALETMTRRLPHNPEAEQAVLGAMMLSTDAVVDVVDVVTGADFYTPAHETVFAALVELFAAGSPTDPVAVAAKLTERGSLSRAGGAEYLHTLMQATPSTASAGYYARIVAAEAMRRRVYATGVRMASNALDGSDDVDDLVNMAQEEVLALDRRPGEATTVTMVDAVTEAIASWDEAQQNPGKLRGLSTGFKKLDKTIGGLEPGRLIVVAGRPAMGKSTLALDFARETAIHNGTPTLLFSLEMEPVELAKRIVAAESNVMLNHMREGHGSTEEWERVAQAAKLVGPTPLEIVYGDSSNKTTTTAIRATCRKVHRRLGLGLVVVDYLQMVTTSTKAENRQVEVAEISRALKLLAGELGVPVVAVAQLNRGPEMRQDKRPLMSDLRESGAIEQDADVVILLHRPEAYDKDDRPGEADLIVAKNRSGLTGIIPVAARYGYGKNQDMPDGF